MTLLLLYGRDNGNRMSSLFLASCSYDGDKKLNNQWREDVSAFYLLFSISLAAFIPQIPITPPPGCAAALHRYRPFTGVR